MGYPCKLTAEQRDEIVEAASNGESSAAIARRFGVSNTLVCKMVKQSKEGKANWRPPIEMLDLFDVLKRKVGGKAARQMVYEHMQLRGIECPVAVEQLAFDPRIRGVSCPT